MSTQPRTQKKILLALTIGISVIGACIYGLSGTNHLEEHGDSEALSRGTTVNSNPQASGLARSGAESLGLKVGDRLRYAFMQERTVDLEKSSNLTVGEAQFIDMKVTQAGSLLVNVYNETEHGWVVGFSVPDASIASTMADRSVLDDSGSELHHEVVAEVQFNGRIGKVVAPPKVSNQCMNHWKDILSRWQTILPAESGAVEWTTEEQDTTGPYRASYTRAPGSSTINKSKLQYTDDTNVPTDNLSSRATLESQAQIHMNPYQKRIEGSESMHLPLAEIHGASTSQVSFRFELKEVASITNLRKLADARIRLLKKNRDYQFSWAPEMNLDHASTEIGRAAARAIGENGSIDQLLDDLGALLDQGNEGTPQEVEVLGRIFDLVGRDSAAVTNVIDRLARNQEQRKAGYAEGLLGVLGAVGTPESQSGLTDILLDPAWPMADRDMALTTLVQTPNPGSKVEEAVRELHSQSGELSDTSLLVLAAMGNRLKETDPARYQSISDYVLSQVNSQPDGDHEIALALGAISNLGPSKVPEVVRTSLESEDSFVRELAVQSLSRIEDPGAGELLGKALIDDPSSSVREAAVRVLSDPGYENGFEALATAGADDPAETVRSSVAHSLGNWVESTPEAEQVLRTMASFDRSESVKQAAADALRINLAQEL